MEDQPGKIYLVPTPIGNMGDITRRAIETLESVDLVACEDTRVTGRLLTKLGFKKRLVSYHEFNERSKATQLVKQVLAGKSIAIVTDSGSPGISDPAFRIVRSAIENQLEVIPLPGPTALIPALTASGLPTDRFFFEGFLSPKAGTRKSRLKALESFPHTLIFYESPHRIMKSLTDMIEILGDREAALCRELSKKFEEIIRGHLTSILDICNNRKLKGEIVIVIAGAQKKRSNKNGK